MAQERYLFDVPDTGLSFKDMEEDEVTRVDTWFDVRAPLLNTPSGEVAAGLVQKTPVSRANLPCAIVSPMVKSKENHSDTKEMALAGRVPANVVGSLAELHVPPNEASAAPAKTPGRLARRRSARQKSAQRRLVAKSQAEKLATTLASKQEVPPTKKRKIFLRLPKKSQASMRACGLRSNNQEKLSEIDVNVSPVRTKAPITPAAPKARNPPSKLKSTEQLELEIMQQMQQEVTELRKKNEESRRVALAGPGQQQKMASHVTKPLDFHFSTDDRIKLRGGGSQPGAEYKEVDFTAALRKCPPSPARGLKGPTVPKPFNLSQGNKRKHEEAAPEYVSLAQQVENFQRRTPSRYHLRSRREEEGVPQSRPLKARLTHPRTPRLETKSRLRPITCKSAAELEAEEIAELQQYKFKAQELNPRILEGGPILPKKPPMKEPTKAIGFDLEIEKRIQERESKKPQEEEEEHFEFRSRPCPVKILEDVVGVPEKRQLPVTIPKSPAFTLKNKVGALAREQEQEKEEAVPVIKAKPMPHFGVPFKPKAMEPRQVEMCPFSFEARDRERLLQKERKIEELQKEEAPKFKAQPVPQFDHVDLPEKKVKSPTKPAPFQLVIDQRGAMRHEMWRQQLKEELKQQKEAASFKAQPSTVVHQVPFMPKKDSKPLSEALSGSAVPDNFELATERRARERKEFYMRLAELDAEKARLQEAARRNEEEHEREQLARLREELVHKANPIRKYQAVEVKPSDQPLTVPQSPNFSDRFRC